MICAISGTALVSAVVHGLLLVIASQDFALRSLSALYLSVGMALELLSGFSVNCTLNLASWGGKKKEMLLLLISPCYGTLFRGCSVL